VKYWGIEGERPTIQKASFNVQNRCVRALIMLCLFPKTCSAYFGRYDLVIFHCYFMLIFHGDFMVIFHGDFMVIFHGDFSW
jgi:hypothetical protein